MVKVHPFKLELIRRRLNQLDVAAETDIHPIRLNRILNGRVEPHEYETKALRRDRRSYTPNEWWRRAASTPSVWPWPNPSPAPMSCLARIGPWWRRCAAGWIESRSSSR